MYTETPHSILHDNDPNNFLIVILNALGYTTTGIALHFSVNDVLDLSLKILGLINFTVSIILILKKINKRKNGK